MQRVRVADERGFRDLAVFRLFDQGFQTTGGAVDEQRLDSSRH
jgi:hypothetical protein